MSDAAVKDALVRIAGPVVRSLGLEIWGVEYRAFFGLPEDMELIFLPYGSADLWPDIPPEMLEQAQRLP